MLVTVFGARGRTGRLVVKELLQSGHTVVAASRRGEPVGGTRSAAVNPVTGEGVAGAVEACDAVVNALASGPGNPSCSSLAQALGGRDGLRYISLAGAAVDHPRDRKGLADRIATRITRFFGGPGVADRQAELAILMASRLRWTMLRAPFLVDGPATGHAKLSDDRVPGLRLTRGDFATTAVRALTDDAFPGRAPFLGS